MALNFAIDDECNIRLSATLEYDNVAYAHKL